VLWYEPGKKAGFLFFYILSPRSQRTQRKIMHILCLVDDIFLASFAILARVIFGSKGGRLSKVTFTSRDDLRGGMW
jgi:hypothetical protein